MSNLSKLPVSNSARQGWPWTEETDEKIYDPSLPWPKISIVTPSYNQGNFIEETIRSVLLQNYPNLEYLIIDAGSTDNTREIIKQYKSWITYWVSEPDRGQSNAINKGVKKCTGIIFNWLNSDDWLVKNALFDIATSFLRNPNADVISGFENHVSIGGQVSEFNGTFVESTNEQSIEFSYISQPSTFFRLACFKQLGLVSEDLHYCMDIELWVRFLLQFGRDRFRKIKKPIANFRFHENSKTVNNLDGNSLAQNFLFEKSSIIIDLQKRVNVPQTIREFWINNVFKTPKVYNLNRDWHFNDNVISEKAIRVYFIKRYINLQFQNGNLDQASWGLNQLSANKSFDWFMIKGLLKLVLKKIFN